MRSIRAEGPQPLGIEFVGTSERAAFAADLAASEAAARCARTCEEALESAGAVTRAHAAHGDYGAWQSEADEAWHRIAAHAVTLPAARMTNPWGVR